MLIFQLFFITIILISSFFGLPTFLFVVSFSLLFTAANVFTLPLLIIQSSVILITATIGFIIATVVSLKNIAEKDDYTDIIKGAFGLFIVFIAIKMDKLLLFILILTYLFIVNFKAIINDIKTIVRIIPSLKNIFTHSIKPSSLKNDVNKVTSIFKSSDGYLLYGLVDKKGNVIVEPTYKKIGEINDSVVLYDDTGYSIIDISTRKIKKLPYSVVSDFSFNGHFSVSRNGIYGLIKLNGDILVECIYDDINTCIDCSFKVYLLCKNNKYGLVKNNGTLLTNIEYDYISHFSNNVAVIKKNNLCGLINNSGNIIVPIIYDDIKEFGPCDTTTSVTHKGKVAVIDLNGKIIQDFKAIK